MMHSYIIYSSVLECFEDLYSQSEKYEAENPTVDLDDLITTLIDIVERLHEVVDDSNQSILVNDIYLSIIDKKDLISTYYNINKIIQLLEFGSIIEQDLSLLEDDKYYKIEDFKITSYEECNLPFKLFGYSNNVTQVDSVAFINLNEHIDKTSLLDSGINNYLLILIISFLNRIDIDDFNGKYIIHNKNIVSKKSILTLVKLHAIFKGKTIHSELTCNFSADLKGFSKFINSSKESINQYEEILVILSEMNNHNGILNKYMSIYHIIENFMNRVPLVEMTKAYDFFRVRDFKNLYNKVNQKELDMLSSLFKDTDSHVGYWKIEIQGIKFSKIVKDKISEFKSLPMVDQNECNDFFSNLGIFKDNAFKKLDNLDSQTYPSLLYKIRCAIVHNKETEYHISHFNLSKTNALVIDLILIHPLMLLIAHLISDVNSNISYHKPSLMLYPG